MARQLRPKTLRAIFGEDKVKNALHVTDLPEDGTLEVNIYLLLFTQRETLHYNDKIYIEKQTK